MTHIPHLSTQDLSIQTPLGRPLFRDLNLKLNDGDRVAIVGRNGTGKSTLLRVLDGETLPSSGRVHCSGSRLHLPQLVDGKPDSSPGERRRQALEQAFSSAPSFLLLDEPSLDLDRASVDWLLGALRRHRGACLVVSHDRRVLRLFNDFFVVSEAGCHHHHGPFDTLLTALAEKQERTHSAYLRQVAHHIAHEVDHVRIARSRERRKQVGRVRAIKRGPIRAQLNAQRSAVHASQARLAQVQEARIGNARDWVKAVRRAIDVALPLEVNLPSMPPPSSQPVIEARALTLRLPSGSVTQPLDMSLSRERWGLFGPNGCGKSTILEGLLGARPKTAGDVCTALQKVGYIAQNAANWQKPECLLELLCTGPADLELAAKAVAAHRFPVALAERPLVSLSPGERVRAALVALCERRPCVELLVLDEPTNHLDLLAASELERVLRAWRGGLLVVSHDTEFLRNIGVAHALCHTGVGWMRREMVSV